MHSNPSHAYQEWSRYFHDHQLHDLQVLHARFIGHRYGRHAHDYFVIELVESGAASYWYRGAQQLAAAGEVFMLNPDEPHTGDPATPGGYIYRVLYPREQHFAQVASDIGTSPTVPFFKDSVLRTGPEQYEAALATWGEQHFSVDDVAPVRSRRKFLPDRQQ